MALPTVIQSPEQFTSLLSSSRIVVTDFYAEWCRPCHQIAPLYEQLSTQLSRPNQITFTKVDVDRQKEIAQAYEITAMPTFVIFKNGNVTSKILGADPNKLSQAIEKLAEEATSGGGSSSTTQAETASTGPSWLGADLPKGYNDVTDKIEVKGVDLLNVNSNLGSARILFDPSKPSTLASTSGKGKEKASDTPTTDWIESDTDQQIMLFMPFTSSLKVHSLHLTSLRPKASEGDDSSEAPTRPKTVNVYSNRAHVLGFEEAEDIPATQTISISPRDWDEKTGTTKLELRFVKFQNVTSLVIFVVDGEDGDAEKVRLDRVRIIGEAGKERKMGKLEKIGDEAGE